MIMEDKIRNLNVKNKTERRKAQTELTQQLKGCIAGTESQVNFGAGDWQPPKQGYLPHLRTVRNPGCAGSKVGNQVIN